MWIRHTDLTALRRVAGRAGLPAAAAGGPRTIEAAVRAAVDNLGGGTLATAAVATFGWTGGSGTRRLRTAGGGRRLAYGVSVERFRRHHGRIVIEQVAEEMLKLCAPRDGLLAVPARAGSANPADRPGG